MLVGFNLQFIDSCWARGGGCAPGVRNEACCVGAMVMHLLLLNPHTPVSEHHSGEAEVPTSQQPPGCLKTRVNAGDEQAHRLIALRRYSAQ